MATAFSVCLRAYQQGGNPECGNKEFVQVCCSVDLNMYSVRLFFSWIA
jgi:hypothetical protein